MVWSGVDIVLFTKRFLNIEGIDKYKAAVWEDGLTID